jgi:monothiol glutaredoxin
MASRLSSSKNYSFRRKSILKASSNPSLDDATKKKITTIISSSSIVLFMKGSKTFPQCGFSNSACRILLALNADFTAVNVLDDDDIRQGIKVYSMWPTIPQLYINGEFIGGSDIMVELFKSGELAKKIGGTIAAL